MRVMIDTNVLISAFLFPSPNMSRLIRLLAYNHSIVLSSYVIEELKELIERKFPDKAPYLDLFLGYLPFEQVVTPNEQMDGLPPLRDPKDLPILVSALAGEADVLITGDEDFKGIVVEGLIILTPAEFIQWHTQN